MNVTVRVVVATLIATMFILLSAPVVAGNVSFKGSVQADASNKVESSVKAGFSTVSVYRTPDGRYSLSANSGSNELAFTAFPPGTPGTFAGQVNQDGSLIMPAGKRLVLDANFALKYAIYNELTGSLAPTGTRKVLEVLAPEGESGGYRLVGATASWVKAREMLSSNPTSFVSIWSWVGPAEAKSVWVTNNNPADSVYDPVIMNRFGSYLSSFNVTTGAPQHFWTQKLQRRVEFDQSGEVAITPAGGYATMFVKSINAVPMATDPLYRIAAIPYEPTGEVVHMGGGDDPALQGRKMWLFDPNTATSDFNFFGADLPQSEGNLQILIVGDLLFRVVGVNNFATSRVYVYNMQNGAKLSQFDLPFKTGQGSESAAFRPEISFSPAESTLYMVVPETGKLYRIDITSGAFGEIPIPQGSGVTYGASDVEVDTSRNVLYVSALGFTGAWYGSGLANGKVFEFPFGAVTPSRSVEVGVGPLQIAVGAVGGVITLFVTNNADSLGPTDTVSRVETQGFTEVLPRFVTHEQPSGIAVQLK